MVFRPKKQARDLATHLLYDGYGGQTTDLRRVLSAEPILVEEGTREARLDAGVQQRHYAISVKRKA